MRREETKDQGRRLSHEKGQKSALKPYEPSRRGASRSGTRRLTTQKKGEKKQSSPGRKKGDVPLEPRKNKAVYDFKEGKNQAEIDSHVQAWD